MGDKIRRLMVRAINDYNMLKDGDRVLVAVSGGKDSAVMLLLLEEIRRRAKIRFTIDAVTVNQQIPGNDITPLLKWLTLKEIPLTVIKEDVYAIAERKNSRRQNTMRSLFPTPARHSLYLRC